MALANRLAGDDRAHLRADRRRRAAGRAVLGVAGLGRQSRPRRDRRDRRPQQDPVGHLGAQRQRPRRPRGQVPRLRLARQPLRRPRRRRARADVPRARRGDGPAEGDHRRHGEGQGRDLHGRARRCRRASCTAITRARRASRSTPAGLGGAAGHGERAVRRARPRRGARPRRVCATRAASRGKTDNLVAAYEQALRRAGEKRHRTCSCSTPISIKDCGLVSFAKRFPDRFVECGIAEQDMVSMAGGMARRGALPVVHSFACFLAARPNEQIYNQCSERSKVIYVGSLAGLLPGGPGHSHQSVRDISALAAACRTWSLAEPCVEAEVGALVDYARQRGDRERLSAPRVGEVADAVCLSGRATRVEIGQGLDRARGRRRDLLRLRAMAAVRTRSRRPRRSSSAPASASALVNLPWLNRVDRRWLREVDRRAPRRSSRSTTTTCTAARARWSPRRSPSSASSRPSRVTRVGVTALPECGTNDEVLAHHGLDVAGLVRGSSLLARAVPCRLA